MNRDQLIAASKQQYYVVRGIDWMLLVARNYSSALYISPSPSGNMSIGFRKRKVYYLHPEETICIVSTNEAKSVGQFLAAC